MKKIFVDASEELDDLPVATESLNARETAEGLFELLNSCGIRPDVAYGDIVEAAPDANGALWLSRTVTRSRFSVIRMDRLDDRSSEFLDCITQLQEDGAGVAAPPQLDYAVVTVPPELALGGLLEKISSALEGSCRTRVLALRAQ